MTQQADLLRSYRNGFQAVYVITTGLQLGLFNQMAKYETGITYPELAKITGYHAPYLRTWCTTAYRYRLLEVDGQGRFRLSPHMDNLLGDPASPDSMSTSMTSAVLRQGPQLASFDEYIKSGVQGSHAEEYGKNPERHDPPRTRWHSIGKCGSSK